MNWNLIFFLRAFIFILLWEFVEYVVCRQGEEQLGDLASATLGLVTVEGFADVLQYNLFMYFIMFYYHHIYNLTLKQKSPMLISICVMINLTNLKTNNI